MAAEPTTKTIALEIHVCDQRRSYKATFSTDDQAVAFMAQRMSTHAFSELEDLPFDYNTFPRAYEALYPTCEHGLSLDYCSGPQHYFFDDEEVARGMGSY